MYLARQTSPTTMRTIAPEAKRSVVLIAQARFHGASLDEPSEPSGGSIAPPSRLRKPNVTNSLRHTRLSDVVVLELGSTAATLAVINARSGFA